MAYLASLSLEQQKRVIGDRLYGLVATRQPEYAAKITGMLLEMDNSELVQLLDQSDQLTVKVNEAVDVLRQHNIIPSAGNA
jgi:polyadenylate-binding protein